MKFRNYDPNTDKKAVYRIWREVGWLEKDDKKQNQAADAIIECGRALVAEVNGEAECLVLTTPGDIRYQDQDLSFSAVAAVTTSRVARKQGLTGRLTALAVAADSADGALVAGLGIFEQGYYNQLGFGNGSYEHWIAFDPAQLKVSVEPRIPRRITGDDWKLPDPKPDWDF